MTFTSLFLLYFFPAYIAHFLATCQTNAISRPIHTYFMRWPTRTILYDLSKPQWRVGLGAGFGVGHSYKFIRISHLVKYVRIAVRSGWPNS